MKRQLLGSLVSLIVAVTVKSVPAQTYEESRATSNAEFILSRIDDATTHEFKKAWLAVGAGTISVEAVLLLYRNIDGSLMATALPLTFEFKKLRFKWDPAAIGVVHTHPNECGAEPERKDRQLADRFGVPVFTPTSRGMFIYDPDTKKTRLVRDRLDWLNPSGGQS